MSQAFLLTSTNSISRHADKTVLGPLLKAGGYPDVAMLKDVLTWRPATTAC